MADTLAMESAGQAIRPKLSRDDWIMRGFILLVGVWMIVVV